METVGRGLDWLIAQPAVQQARVGLVGSSKGGELALLAAATYPDKVGAVVGYVPSPLVWQGLAFDRRARRRGPTSSWTIAGEPVPFLPFARPRGADMLRMAGLLVGRPAALRPTYEGALDDLAAVERATIPIENIAGPVMLISGADDQMWPSTRLCELAMDRLRAHGHRFPYRHLSYDHAGHLITPLGVAAAPTTIGRFKTGGSPEANAQASADAWPKVLDVLAASS